MTAVRCLLLQVAGLALFGVSPARSQTPVTPMTPSPAHEAMAFFEGSWTTEERPADQRFVETCNWLPSGRRHMVCKSTWQTPTGPREGWSIFSFRAADSTYIYTGLRAGGTLVPMTGRSLPDGWEFLSETGSGATRERAKVAITRLGPQRFRLVASTATGDGPWQEAGVEHYIPAPRTP